MKEELRSKDDVSTVKLLSGIDVDECRERAGADVGSIATWSSEGCGRV